ncbi:hypothetical protein ACFXP3_01745 [Streptomyces sp. NPDC059096]|uniref:hypothetical protein n=1 Tax=Streptomyces sp. NPDC059096 TaxID=3346727 RepID=UPI0036BE9101
MTPQAVMSLGAIPEQPFLLAAGGSLTALSMSLARWIRRRRNTAPDKRLDNLAVKVATLAALACTAYSADTSWRFAADYLDMAGTAERAAMFATAELALFANALMARQNLAAIGVPGVPGTLVWVITAVQVIPAYAESGLVGGTVRAFVGPIMAAVLWHQAMGIELRLRTPGAASHGLIATLGREARERLLSRLGIAVRDRDAAQITRDRAMTRAVALAARLAELTPEQRINRSGRRLTRRLSKAIGRAAISADPARKAELLDQLAARRHAGGLATVPLSSPWSPQCDREKTSVVPEGREPNNAVLNRPHVPAGDRDTRNESLDQESGAGLEVRTESPARALVSDRGPSSVESGTDPTGDRGPTTPDTGTDPTGDRGPTTPDTGTDPTGDRGPTTPDTGTDPTGDRGPTVAPQRRRATKAGSDGKQRPRHKQEQSMDQLIHKVSPHVPALLARDGNEAVTRAQLREILRREGLPGGRNDRLSLVLQRLRAEMTTKTTRSSTR